MKKVFAPLVLMILILCGCSTSPYPGNFYKVNKVQGTTDFRHESSTNLHVTPDGSIELRLRGGVSFLLSSYGTFNLDTGLLEINNKPDGTLEVMSETNLYFQALQTTFNSDVTIGGNLAVNNGASGFIWTLSGLVEVKDGIIVSISNN